MKNYWLPFLSVIGFVLCIEHDFKGFDDSIQFGINWPGKPENLEGLVEGEAKEQQNNEILKVSTTNKETYECHIPIITAEETTSIEDYDGPSPLHLLKPLFLQKICSYRLESYWSYEVCHGRYIRQYHEEREGKQSNLQQYFLGHWSAEKQVKLEDDLKDAYKSKEHLKTVKVDGNAVPYVEMAMDDGTICDLSGKPRLTRVRYVCYVHGKHDVYSFKETSTCEYEIIILSPLLCEHPLFNGKPRLTRVRYECYVHGKHDVYFFKETSTCEYEIIILSPLLCEHPLFNGKPRLTRVRYECYVHGKHDVYSFKETSTCEYEIIILSPLLCEHPLFNGKPRLTRVRYVHGKHDVYSFKKTSTCEYEIIIFSPLLCEHPLFKSLLKNEVDSLRFHHQTIRLNEQEPKDVLAVLKVETIEKTAPERRLPSCWASMMSRRIWTGSTRIRGRPRSLLAKLRTSVSHFYSNGDVCDKTGKPRQTEVKLKCLENSSSPAQVSIYLLEPRTCHYILGVESPLICDILPLADEHGLIKSAKPVLTRQDNVIETKEEDSDFKQTIIKLGND
ncbi:putative xtp3-transactivated protein b [Operophtera brumata]|uniref:Endoplasmic reticulum lectin 1 n=1 Tax=Operophtera brumata TaxID=104452 RepID=A0A0L7LLR9_OPEBR|nr:putative xtp3-transactivated protein b [Operophtera brumata]